jgi:hypothetical protein
MRDAISGSTILAGRIDVGKEATRATYHPDTITYS